MPDLVGEDRDELIIVFRELDQLSVTTTSPEEREGIGRVACSIAARAGSLRASIPGTMFENSARTLPARGRRGGASSIRSSAGERVAAQAPFRSTEAGRPPPASPAPECRR